ncbi:ubiquitin-like modifier-activating enzyme ATG7 [Coccinella septempunctata]|uniref:ubiquitin-like modifier-activating enzyme ATG7 n=1 Tax=Coccinella septempunctata TaxID=41139 RepID=UPI001D067DCD|nr:ubiquitin-like modifier-activating enzyme ATG7 [Coccinella septempunctata]
MTSKPIEFVPISSLINPSFWNKLSEIKLNDDKLSEKEHPVWGYFSNINNKCKIPILEVNSTSFNSHFDSQKIYIPFHGRILNVNTIELFKDFDKTQCINRIGQDIFTSIENGQALETPSLLNQFFILSYADLKKFNFYYWFAFPVPYKLSLTYNNIKNIYDVFDKDQLEYIWDKYCEMESSQKPYFLISLENGSVDVFQLKHKLKFIDGGNCENYYFVFYDLSLLENCPGSTLRNYVTLILQYCSDLQGKSINFLSLRIKRNEDYKLTISESLIFNAELPVCHTSVSDFINEDPDKRWVGWEKNERGKLGPRMSNMKSFLDPKELAESSVDLNLKLMKWRLLSNIDLEKIKATKFLLLGAGTLGCSVARILLGWGARHISFIDNSVVSYSNPVRQSLFTFEDSQNSKPKSVAAAENLRKIFPGVKSKSYQMTIPMPGHPVGESTMEQLKKDVELLTNLVSEHDVIFLLMDSRESRWFPTLLGSYFNKIVINAALGFDSYLVMRHGVRVDTDELKVRQHKPGFKSLKGNFLGCYFCNDVTAPGNSTKDRTLDQQCTVTRPGISAIAGALAAELAISLLQHKEGAKAAAFYQLGSVVNPQQELDNQCVLGIIPHSIRGYLSSFSQVLPAVERYQQCTACSQTILDAYHKDGFGFLVQVFQNSKYLEDVSGLATMNKEAEDTTIWEFSDEEEVHCTDYEDNDSDNASKISHEKLEKVDETETVSGIPEKEEQGKITQE